MSRHTWLDGLTRLLNAQRLARRPFRDTARIEALETRLVLAAPTLAAIADVTFLSGSPVHIPLNSADADGDALTFQVSSDNASLRTEIPTGNRSLRITVQQGGPMSPAISGEMTFELFEEEASRATDRVITLAESGFYDGSEFHRVEDNFLIQGGDPNGNPPGTGSSSLGTFDDQFHPDLQHNRTGMLSFARSVDDTNDSQFLITEFVAGTSSESRLRDFDFDRTIFGVQTTGESIRAAISDVDVIGTRPLVDVVMTSVDVFVDNQNGVLRISAPEGTTGTATVTVSVSDGSSTAQQTFDVSFSPDTHNNHPYLADLPRIRTLTETSTSFQLTAVDLEGAQAAFLDEVALSDRSVAVPHVANPAEVSYDIEFLTGAVSVQPAVSFVGTTQVTVSTGEFVAALDYQVVPIEIVAVASPFTVSTADHPGRSLANDGRADEIRVVRNGSRIEVSVNGQATAQAEDVSVTSLTLNGSRDDDTLIIDYSGGNPFPSGGIQFHGYTVDPGEINPPPDTGLDAIELTGGTVGTATYHFVNATDGSIGLDGRVLTYTGLEPIEDNLLVTHRAFHFSSASDAITVGDDDVPANGLSRIATRGTAETVHFSTPTGSLTIAAGPGNDRVTVRDLESGPFAVTVSGGTGNDTLIGSVLNDLLHGNDGNDLVWGGAGDDTISGGVGNDTLNALAGSDRVFSGTGNDVVDGGVGDDQLFGDAGNDTISGANGRDFIRGGTGADVLRGGFGFDTLSGDPGNDTITAGAGNDTVYAGNGLDSVFGEDGHDRLFGGDGYDTVLGGPGDDFLRGGRGRDRLFGEDGHDHLLGDEHNDTLGGSDGHDTLSAGAGADAVFGGTGDDLIDGDIGDDRLFGDTGRDTVAGSSGRDLIRGGTDDDLLNGGAGFDTLHGDQGNDRIMGGEGNDTVYAGNGLDSVSGDSGDDRLFGGNGYDTIFGGTGNDFLRGGRGQDRLSGDTGDDVLLGDEHNDTLTGSNGNDRAEGGAGADTIDVQEAPLPDGIDSVIGSDGADTVFADPADLMI